MAVGKGKGVHQDYVEALEEERRKIQMFARELPLCLHLVTGAIKNCRRRMANDEACSDEPVLEKFMPLRPSFSSLGSHESLRYEDESPSHNKPDWLRSVQLWGSPEAEEPPAGGSTLRKPVAVNARKIRGAFQPFERERQALAGWFPSSSAPPVISVRNMANTFRGRGDVGPEEKEKERGELLAPAAPHRKQRRCWCPDLHGKFLRALEELGGSQAATPKQIRELMNVEGLTIDEVKSHLQKYRLHTRSPRATVHSNDSHSSARFMVGGSIWVSPPDYVAATATTTMNEIYSPTASIPLELELSKDQQNKNLKTNVCHHFEEAATKSNSSSTYPSSSQTTTASPSL